MTVKRDEEEELMMTTCNQVLANTLVHKEPLSWARYTAPRTLGYEAQIKKLERYDNQLQQKMAPFHATSTVRVQNRCTADVVDKTQGTPLGKEEASSCHIILVKEQQLDSTTKPDDAMMRYIPEGTQIWAVNAAKTTICDMLNETMVNTAVPPGMEAGFAQPVMATAALPPEDKVQFMDETEGGGEP